MTRLLDRTPFSEHTGEVAFGGKQVVIRADQIIAWVSLTPFRVKEQNPIVVPFPVIVDTGYNHTFSILERHLVEWTGLRPEALHAVAAVRDRGQRLMLREANLWMHVNETRKRDRLAGVEPHMLGSATRHRDLSRWRLPPPTDPRIGAHCGERANPESEWTATESHDPNGLEMVAVRMRHEITRYTILCPS